MAAPPLDIPHDAPFAMASFEQAFLNAEITPSDMPHLEYSLAVPKTWPFSQSFGPCPRPLGTRGSASRECELQAHM